MRLAGDAIGNAIERDLSERDRVRLATRLERALRLQMVGQLASGVAHNFNNIIGAILGKPGTISRPAKFALATIRPPKVAR
jgi:hypothetical protein